MSKKKHLFHVVLALSLHAVFEGLAVGLEGHTDDVWTLFTGKFCYFVTFITLLEDA